MAILEAIIIHSDMSTNFSFGLSLKHNYVEFMINHKVVKVPREKGIIIIFPSFILHRITPITKGTRKSIVGWVAGAPFR